MRRSLQGLMILITLMAIVPITVASDASRQPMPTTLLAAWQEAGDFPYFVAQEAVLASSGAPNDQLLHPAAVTAIGDYLELSETEGCVRLRGSTPVYLEAPPLRRTIEETIRAALHGFLALRQLDSHEMGGNFDGVVDSLDSAFDSLLLWTDGNHNGLSEPGEITPLRESSVTAISVQFRERRKKDSSGNWLRYWSRAWRWRAGQQVPTSAVDVYFVALD